jgi:hypothetical protein
MTLQSKSFLIYKGDTLENIAQFLQEEIGLNAFLIKTIKGVSLSTTVTQITLLFESYPTDILDSIAPREGAIFTTGVASDDFDLRFLFNDPVDFRSIQSGTFSIDGVGLDIGRVYLDPGSNDYFLKVSASGANFQSDAFHTYQLSTSLKRRDGSTFSYTPVGGYVFHTLSNAHIGDYTDPYIGRRRGKVAVAVVRLSKGLNPQLGITEFLSQRQLSADRLIAYTPISTSTNTVDVYFIYIDKLEPQIISGFPLNNSLLPDISAPGKVTFVFNTPLDKAKLSSTTGLFSIEEGFNTSTSVPPSKVTLLDDLQTVEIDTSTYFTSQKIYSILARPGILGLGGLAKEKPEQWTIHIASYEGGAAATGEGATGVSLETFNILEAAFTGHTGDPTIHYTQAEIDIGTGQINDLPPLVSVSEFTELSGQYAGLSGEYSSLSGEFVSHTGETGIHYTQSEISIPTSQIYNISEYSTTGMVGYVSGELSGHSTNTSNPHSVTAAQVDSPTTLQFTGHTGVTGIHFTQGEIEVVVSQIRSATTTEGFAITADGAGGAIWTEITGEAGTVSLAQYNYLSGEVFELSGMTTGHTGDLSIHYTQASISITESQISNLGAYATGQDLINLSGEFTSHTGDPAIHFTVGSISLPASQINTEGATSGYVLTAQVGSAAGWEPVAGGEVTTAQYNYLSGEHSGHVTGYDGHTGDLTIHYTEGSINHANIANVGTYSHASIDNDIASGITHAADTTIHYTTGQIVINASQIDIAGETVGNVLTVGGESSATWELAADAALSGLVLNIEASGQTHYASLHPEVISDLTDVAEIAPVDNEQLFVRKKGVWTNTGYLIETLGDITDIVITTPSEGEVLTWIGGDWINDAAGASSTTLTGLTDTDILTEYEGAVIGWNTASGAWTDMAITGANGIIVTPVPSINALFVDGSSLMQPLSNLSDVDDIEIARHNLKARYAMEDMIDYSFLSSSDTHDGGGGGGSAFVYSQNISSFMTGYDTMGVMVATNSSPTGVGLSAGRRMQSAGGLDLDNPHMYYFRTATNQTTLSLIRFGLVNTTFNSEDDMVDGAYFEFDSTVSSNWYACTAAASSRTKTDTSVVVTADTWKWWGIRGSTSGVYFYDLDTDPDVAVVFTSTNIPATNRKEMRVFISSVANGGSNRNMYIDKFMYPIYADYLPTGVLF